jgi:hypothetical protein
MVISEFVSLKSVDFGAFFPKKILYMNGTRFLLGHKVAKPHQREKHW